jgi:phage repressor protein C with HTH and peptisase S24 domain
MAKKTTYSVQARRRALQDFIDRNDLEVQTWARASNKTESVVRHFLAGRSQSMSDRTYVQLAEGASELLSRTVTAGELRGEPDRDVEIAIRTYVGAGDEVVEPIEGDPPIGLVAAPPELAEGEATEVRGRSMLPAYEEGDLLFHKFLDPNPRELLGKLVVAKLLDGRRFVKVLLSGTMRGRFNLQSLNQAYPTMENQVVVAAARIVWVKKAQK